MRRPENAVLGGEAVARRAKLNASAKGARRERQSRDLLEAAGYQVVRAGASLGDWDLVGIGTTDFVLCQVKSRDWPGTLELRALQDQVVPRNCRKLIHRWRDRMGLPDVRQL